LCYSMALRGGAISPLIFAPIDNLVGLIEAIRYPPPRPSKTSPVQLVPGASANTGSTQTAQKRDNQPFIRGTRILPTVQNKHIQVGLQLEHGPSSPPHWPSEHREEKQGTGGRQQRLLPISKHDLSNFPLQVATAGAQCIQKPAGPGGGCLNGRQRKGAAKERVISTYRRFYHSEHKPALRVVRS